MNRKTFIKSLAMLPFTAVAAKVSALNYLVDTFPNTPTMPVFFLGHGSPMNAIEDNEFVQGFRNVAKNIPKPAAILCISAHWETKGTMVTAMPRPRTIHDFGGFPQALFDVQYPAPGSPSLANLTKGIIKKTEVHLDDQWGLDHGAWSVVKHLYPNADVPIIQMSIDYTQGPQYHYELAQELKVLRNKGVLIIGSGNMVHNLSKVAWDRLGDIGYAYDWAIEANERMKKYIVNADHKPLIDYRNQGLAFIQAIPTPEHYLPLLYSLALQDEREGLLLFNDKPVAGSLTMTSVMIG